MLGQPVQLLVNSLRLKRLDRIPDRAVKFRALSLEKAVVGHLLRERVLEPIHRARDDTDLLNDSELPEPVEALLHLEVVSHCSFQNVARELASHDGSVSEESALRSIEAIEPRPHDAMNRVRELERVERPGDRDATSFHSQGLILSKRLTQLLEEKRVPPRPVVEKARDWLGYFDRPQRGSHHRCGVVQGQGSEHDGDVTRVGTPVLASLRARRDHDEEGIRGPHLSELTQHLLRGSVNPVPILEQDDRGLRLGTERQQRREILYETDP